jgi:thioesterase domain-containing protein
MTGSLQALEDFLHAEVPLVRAMGVRIKRYDDEGVVLAAPLEANRNYRGTAFAGSLATLVTLAGWALTHLKVQEMGLKGEAAASQSHIDFLKPVTVATIEAFCPMPAPEAIAKLQRMLLRRGMGRWELSAHIRTGDELAVAFSGSYAVTAVASKS